MLIAGVYMVLDIFSVITALWAKLGGQVVVIFKKNETKKHISYCCFLRSWEQILNQFEKINLNLPLPHWKE